VGSIFFIIIKGGIISTHTKKSVKLLCTTSQCDFCEKKCTKV
jgi:hypothetical protein